MIFDFFKKKDSYKRDPLVEIVTIEVPVTIESKYKWEVRWESRSGEYSIDTRPEVKVFFNENEAREFKEQLKWAYELLKYKNYPSIEINKLDNT